MRRTFVKRNEIWIKLPVISFPCCLCRDLDCFWNMLGSECRAWHMDMYGLFTLEPIHNFHVNTSKMLEESIIVIVRHNFDKQWTRPESVEALDTRAKGCFS